jgi:hypothetical protein
MAPATQSIMSALPPAKAGVGSAINDTTRNLGSVLGIAVIGGIVTSAYKTALAPTHIAASIPPAARQSIGAATQIARRLPHPLGHELATVAHDAFVHAADRGVLVAAGITIAGAIIAARALPGPGRATELTSVQEAATARATDLTPVQQAAPARA